MESLRFMAPSIDKLAFNFGDNRYMNFREFYKGDRNFKLLRRKDVYPYQNMDN